MGTPQITWRYETFLLARRQARALLYYLANAFAPVSRDKLLFLFWPDEPDVKARRNLTRLISYLRMELPHPEILLVAHESLWLNPELVSVDTLQFTELCAQDAAWEEAVALYRGPFLIGFSFGGSPEFDFWLTEEQRHFEALYLKTLAGLMRAKTEQRDFSQAIQYAQRYLAVDPLAEEIHQKLITLHAANGDRTAALQQYETCVEVLERELGVSPLPETHAAYEAARKGKSSPARSLPVKPAWTVLPSLDLPLIGRETAWEALTSAYQQKRTGGMILISGEAGVGRTRLMQEFAKKNAHTVLIGNSHPSTQSLPYHPIVQALRQVLHHARLWRGIPPLWLGELTTLLPELNDHFSGLPQPLEFEPEQAQIRLFEALTQVVMGLAVSDPPLLLCLDDLQWADEATLGWLSAISRRLADSRVCIVGTCRQEESDSVQGVQRAYRRAGLLTEVKLAGLSRKAIGEILRQVPGISSTQTPLAAQLSHTTGGNTFFVLETVRALIESEQLNTPPEHLPLPDTVQETIQTRLARLEPLARQILDAAAVLSPNLEPAVLSETAGRTELEAADGLDELVRSQLLLKEGKENLAFRHDLVCTAVYEALTPWRRRLLHKRAAEALADLYRLKQGQVAHQIAQHYDAAGEVVKAAHFYYLAALASRRVYAHEESIDYLQRAIQLSTNTTPKWHEIAQYYELLGESLVITGKFEAARQTYSHCLDQIPDEAYLQQVKCQTKLAGALDSLNLLDQAEEIYCRALEILNAHLDDQEKLAWQRAWLDIHLARLGLFYRMAKPENMRTLLKEIQPVIEKAGTPEQRSQFYEQQAGYRLHQDRYAVSEQTVLSVEANLRANLEIGNPVRIAAAKFRLGFVLLWSGNPNAAETPLTEAFEMAEETGRLPLKLLCVVYLTCLRRLQGDVEGARAYATSSLEIAQQLNSVIYLGASYGNLAWLDWKAHKFDQAERKASKALSVWGDHHYPFKWLANWVSLAVYLDGDQLGKAIEAAKLLLDPKQLRQPDEITMALESGIKNWEDEDIEKSSDLLEHAVNLAKKWGYL